MTKILAGFHLNPHLLKQHAVKGDNLSKLDRAG